MFIHLIHSFKNIFSGFRNNLFIKTWQLLIPQLWVVKQFRLRTLFTALIFISEIAATLSCPYLFNLLIDSLQKNDHTSSLIISALLSFSWCYKTTADYLGQYVFYPVINALIRDKTLAIIEHLQKLPLEEFEKFNMPDILSRLQRLSQSFRTFLRGVLFDVLPLCIKFAVALLTIEHILSGKYLFTLIFLMAYSIGVYYLLQAYLKKRKNSWNKADWRTIAVAESLNQTPMLAFDQTHHQEQLYKTLQSEAASWVNTNSSLQLMLSSLVALQSLALFAVLLVSTHQYNQGLIDIKNIGMIYMYVVGIFNQTQKFFFKIRQVFEAVIDIEKIQDILSTSCQKKEILVSETPCAGEIILSNLAFTRDHNLILQGINFSIKFGEKVLIEGCNGAGKSTLCKLLLGLYTPSSGQVLWNGRPIQSYDPKVLEEHVAFISQNAHPLFTQTDQPKTPLLQKLLGYDGRGLSGGEQQLLLIEQALKKKPSVMVLDESLSQLSPSQYEKTLKLIIQQVPTVILVSHTHSSCQFDKVIDLNKINIFDLAEQTVL